MTKEYIINEYIPFMVKYALEHGKPYPKGEKELIQFSQELGKHVIDRYEDIKRAEEKITPTSERNASTIIKECN